MKKISIATLGLLAFIGIIYGATGSFLSLARGGDDYIALGLFLLMPAVLISFLVYKLIKSPKIYNNFQKTICFLTIGIIIGFIQFIFFLIYSLLDKTTASEFMLLPIILFIFIFILSLISAIAGLIIDLKNRNKNGGYYFKK